ncbi:MAG: hypothetical protein ACK4GO_18035 [Gemmobacter sp.]
MTLSGQSAGLGLVLLLMGSAPAFAWERAGYGCAATVLACPPHLTPAEAQIILGIKDDAEARVYWTARFGAPGGKSATVTPGTYRSVAAMRQIIYVRQTCRPQTAPHSPGPSHDLAVTEGGLTLNGRPLFRYDLTESDFLLITGLCGHGAQHDGRSVAQWLGPDVIFASDDAPEAVGETSGYWLIAPNGRMAAILAGQHSAVPVSAGGTAEEWIVTLYEDATGGRGGTVTVGGTANRFPGHASPTGGGGILPGQPQPPPDPPPPLTPLQVADRFWQPADPCNSLRRIADGLDLIGRAALLPERPAPGDSPRRCIALYDDLRRRLSDVPATDARSLRPVFLWTIEPATPQATAAPFLWTP